MTRTILTLAAMSLLTVSARAQTYTGTASGTFTNIQNWNFGAGPIPFSAPTTDIRVNQWGAGNLTISNDLNLTLRTLTLANNSNIGMQLVNALNGNFAFNTSGSAIDNVGQGITSFSNTGSTIITIGSDLASLGFTGAGAGNVPVSNVIAANTGSGGLAIGTTQGNAGTGLVTFAGLNTFNGGVTLNSGTLEVTTTNGLGVFQNVLSPLTVNGGNYRGNITLYNPVTTNTTLNYIGSASTIFSGVISGGGGVALRASGINAIVSNTMAQTYTGPTLIAGRDFATSNIDGGGIFRLQGGAGSILATSGITLRDGATFDINNNITGASLNNPHVSTATPITANSGFLQFIGNAGYNTQALGETTLTGGVTILSGSTVTTELTISNLKRSSGGFAVFAGTSLGLNPAVPGGPSQGNVILTQINGAAPATALVGGGGLAGTTNISIIPWAVGETGTSGQNYAAGSGFVTYGTNGVRLLNVNTEYNTSNNINTAAITDNIRITNTPTALAASKTVNSLFLNSGQTISGIGTLTLTSGTLGSINASSTLSVPVAFGTEANVFVGGALGATNTLSLIGGFTATNFTKSGHAGLTIGTVNPIISGAFTINSGTVTIDDVGRLGGTSPLVFNGQTFSDRAILSNTNIGAQTLSASITINGGYGTIQTTTSSSALLVNSTISGSGGASFTNTNAAGQILVRGTNSYTGGTRLGTGIIDILNDGNLGNARGPVQANGTTLRLSGAWTSSRNIHFETATSLISDLGNNSTLSGAITGSIGVTKTGAGIMTISGANNGFNNTLTLGANAFAGGTLALTGSLEAAAVIVGIAGTTGTPTLDISGAASSRAIRQIDGIITGSVVLGNNNLIVGSSGAALPTVIQGNGGLVKVGAGTLNLTGTNSFLGGVQIYGGVVTINTNAALGNANGAVILAGGTLFANSASNITPTRTFNLVGSNLPIIFASSVVTLPNGFTNGAGNLILGFSSTIAGSGGLSISGSNTGLTSFDFATGNTFTGDVQIGTGGRLNADTNGALGAAGNRIRLNGGELATTSGSTQSFPRTIFVTANSTLSRNGVAANVSFDGPILGTATLTQTFSGPVTLGHPNPHFYGTYTIGDGFLAGNLTFSANGGMPRATLTTASAANATITLSNLTREFGAINTTSGSTLVLGTSGKVTVGYSNAAVNLAGLITGGNSSAFTKVGSGTLAVDGANSGFMGTVNILGTGAVTIGAAGSISAASGLSIGGIHSTAGIGPSFTLGTASTNVDRLPNTVTVNSNSSTFVFTSNTTTTNSEVYGGLNGSGLTFVTMTAGGTLTGGTTGLTRQDRGTFNFRAVTGTLGNGAATTAIANITFSNSATLTGQLIGGGGTLNTGAFNVSILPYATGGSATGNSFVTYGANGIYALTTSTEFYNAPDTATFNTAPADNNVRVSPASLATVSLTSARTVNSLILAGSSPNSIRLDGASILTVTSGAVLASQNNVYVVGSATYASTVLGIQNSEIRTGASNTRELVVHANAGDLNIGALISTSGGLTKSGASTLYLTNNANTFTGGLTVNAGILNIDSLGAINAANNAITLSGGVLRYRGPNASNNSSLQLTGTGTIHVVSGTTLTLGNGLGGAGNLAKDGTGTLVLTGGVGVGTKAATIIRGGALSISFANAITPDGVLYFGDSTVSNGGGVLRMTGSFTLPNPVTQSEGTTGTGFGFDVPNAAHTVELSGTITSNSAQTRGLYKVGAGNLTLTANNNYFGSTQVFGGTLTLSGANGAVISSQGNSGFQSAATYYIAPGAALVLDNVAANNNNRIGDVWDTPFGTGDSSNGRFQMNGGEFRLRANAAGTTERINQFVILTGTITLEGGGGQLISGRVFRASGQSAALIRGTGLGGTPGPGSTNWFAVDLGSGSTQTGGAGGAAGTPFVSIIPGFVGSTTATGTGDDLVTYHSAAGFRTLIAAEYTTTIPTTNFDASRAPNLSVSGTTTAPATTSWITAAKLTSGATLNGDGHLVLTQSTILATSSAAISTPALGSVGNSGYNFHVSNSVDTLTVQSVLTGSVLMKYGAGTLQLNQPLMSGGLIVGQGTLELNGTAAVQPVGGTVQVFAGATFSLGNANRTIDSLTTTGNVGTTNLNQAQDGTVALGSRTLSLFGTGSSTFTGTLTGSGGLTKTYNSNAATLTLTQPQSYTGETRIDAGVLNLAGSATLASTTVSIRGGTLQLTNSDDSSVATGYVANRLPGTATLNLAGLIGITANTNAVQDITLPITNLIGNGTLGATASSSAPTTITFTQLNRAANKGTFIPIGTSLGLTPSPSGNTRIFATQIDGAAPSAALVGGGGADSSLTVSIVPWALAISGSTSFMTYGANGFRPLDTLVEYASGTTLTVGNTNTNDNIRQAGLVTLGGAGTVEVNSILNTGVGFTGAASVANTLIIRSGALVITSGSTFAPGTGGSLAIQTGASNTRELVVFNSSAVTLNAVIGTSGGVTKYGPGALTLSGVNTFSGGLAIHGGTVNFAALNNLGAAGQTIIMGGDSPTLTTFRGLLYTGNSSITLTNPIVLNSVGGFSSNALGSSYIVTLAGNVSGDGSFNLSPSGASAGILELDGTNTYTGGTVFFASTSATTIISIQGDQSLGNGPGIEISTGANAPIFLRGNWTTGKILRFNSNYPINTNGFDATLNGPIIANGFIKVGSGTARVTYPNSFSNGLGITISGGDVVLEGRGSLAGGTQTVIAGSRLILDNTATHFPDRIGDASNLSLSNGEFRLLANSGVLAEEVVNNLTASLASTVTLVTGPALVLGFNGGSPQPASPSDTPAILRVNGSFTRSAISSILFRGRNLGTAVPGTPDATNVMFTFPLNSIGQLTGGGGAAGSSAISIIAGAFGDSSATGQGTQMVTYDFDKGVRLLSTSEYITNPANLNGRAVSDNVRYTASAALANITTLNALMLDGNGVTLSGAGTLTLSAGNVLAKGTGQVISSVLTTPSNFALAVCVTSGSDLTISSTITSLPGGFIKRGDGTLTLSGPNSFNGIITLAAGTLNLANATALGNSSNTIRALGGTLGIGVSSLSITPNLALAGDLTVDGTFSTLNFTGSVSLENATRTLSVAAGKFVTLTGLIGTNAAGVGLTKSGLGVLIIPTNNTNYATAASNFYYLATTTVNQGILRVTNTSGSATGGTRVTVNNGGTLDGGGFIVPAQTLESRNLVTINSGGTIRPGTGSAGTLTIGSATTPGITTATVRLESGGIFSFNTTGALASAAPYSGGSATPGSGNNQLVVNGVLNYDALANFAIVGDITNYNTAQPYSFRVATATSLNGVSITDPARFDTTAFTGYTGQYFLSLGSFNNNLYLNFTLAPLPEPLLLGVLAAGLLLVRRRK